MKVVIIERNGRKFKCWVTGGTFSCTCSVTVKEIIHPNRKFFKTEFWGFNKEFFYSDFKTIMSGVKSVVDEYLEEQVYENATMKKWKEFEEKA